MVAAQGGCARSGELTIAPIDAEMNRYLMSDRLDPQLYDTRRRRQYYQVANIDAVSAESAQLGLDALVRRRYSLEAVARIEELSVLFYAGSLFADYASDVPEAARSDAGFLPGFRADLVAQTRLGRVPGSRDEWSRSRVQYVGERKRFSAQDIVMGDTVFAI